MSALLSAGRRVPTDSGAAYSSVPVFPVRPALASMSRDVPKSQSIARGLSRCQRMYAKAECGRGRVHQPAGVGRQQDVARLEVEVEDRLVVLVPLEISPCSWTAIVTNQEGKPLHDVLQQAVDLVRPEQVHRPQRALVGVHGLRTRLRRPERADARGARVGRVVCAGLRRRAASARVPEPRGEEVVERARLRPLHQHAVRRVSGRSCGQGRTHWSVGTRGPKLEKRVGSIHAWW
jgi:hypothetical protein